jgi:hypothetical protein
MQIILSLVAKLGASGGVGLMRDKKAQVRTSNKISGEPGSTIGIGNLSLLEKFAVTGRREK